MHTSTFFLKINLLPLETESSEKKHIVLNFYLLYVYIYYSYLLRPVTDDELHQINGRIDEKISRRRQQQYEQEQRSKQSQSQSQSQQQTNKSTPVTRSSPSSTSDSSRSLINSSAPPPNDEEYSIFRDPPSSTVSLPITTTSRVSFFKCYYL